MTWPALGGLTETRAQMSGIRGVNGVPRNAEISACKDSGNAVNRFTVNRLTAQGGAEE